MAETARFFGILIRMYVEPNEANHRPHFHAYYKNAAAAYAADALDVLGGALPTRQQRLVEAWAELHRDEIVANWERLWAGQPPAKIEPLR